MSESKLDVADMLKASLASLAEVKGSTMADVEKYVEANYPEDEVDFRRLRRTFSTGVSLGWLVKDGEKYRLAEVAKAAAKASPSAKKAKKTSKASESKEEATETAADAEADAEADADADHEASAAAAAEPDSEPPCEDKPMPPSASANDEEVVAEPESESAAKTEAEPQPAEADSEGAASDAVAAAEDTTDPAAADAPANDGSAEAGDGDSATPDAVAGTNEPSDGLQDQDAVAAEAEAGVTDKPSEPSSMEDEIKVAITALCKKDDAKATLEAVMKHLDGKVYEEEAVKGCMDEGIKTGWLIDGGEAGFHLRNPVQTPEKVSA